MRTILLAVTLVWAANAQDAKTVLDAASKALGAANLKTIEYTGAGAAFSVGQSVSPNGPWPRLTVKSYQRAIDYTTPAQREESLRVQPTGAEQRVIQLVSGTTAWNMAGNNPAPAPAAMAERLTQIWITPHGFVKAAMAAGSATAKSRTAGGKKTTVVSFLGHGKFRVSGTINDQGLVERVETWVDNPVLGDMVVEAAYSDYKDFSGVKFPGKIEQRAGGHPALELTVSGVRPNASVSITAPAAVQSAKPPPVRVETQKLGDGVWYLMGGSHHSLAVEFKDHVVVIEGPLNEERSAAVIAEVKKTIPNKPIRYLVNTHHHFDHSGGLRTYVAEGARIVTLEPNKAFYQKAFAAGRTLNPDRMAKEKKKAVFVTFRGKHLLTDGSRTIELHHIQGSPHNDAALMVYIPKEKLLVEADVYSPAAPNAPAPATPNPASVNLYENIQRLKLDVGQLAPIHGRVVPLGELEKAIGKKS